MEFQTEQQAAVYQRILPWMHELFQDALVASDTTPEFAIRMGSTIARIAIQPVAGDALICTRAYVVRGCQLHPELLLFLLRENHNAHMGAFGLDHEGDIFIQHTILGSTCDPPELKSSVLSVASLADRHDDAIANQWGGERGIDRVARLQASS